MFENCFKGKKVLITGHTGFKGAWLALWLISLGAEVAGYSLEPPTNPNLFNILNLKKDINHIIGDIRDSEKLNMVFNACQPDIVFHLAAQSLVLPSYDNPKLTYETNIIGTVNLFEAVRKTGSVRVVINITSDKCYENKEWVYSYRENDPMGGYDPYSSSKGACELVANAYRNSFFNTKDYGQKHNVAIASARAGNVVGGGDWAENRLIPDCIRALVKNEKIIIRNPDSERPWQLVLEPLSGYLKLADLMWNNPVSFNCGSKSDCSSSFSQGWNFGPAGQDSLNVIEVAEQIIKLWGKGSYEIKPNLNAHETELLRLDTAKACSKLGWNAVYNVQNALESTINWYKNYYYHKNIDIKDYTLKQIEDYSVQMKKLNLKKELIKQ